MQDTEEGSIVDNGTPWVGEIEQILQVDSVWVGTRMGGVGGEGKGNRVEGENVERIAEIKEYLRDDKES